MIVAKRSWEDNSTSDQVFHEKKNQKIVLHGKNRFIETIIQNLGDMEMLEILDSAKNPITINDICETTGLSVSTVYRKVEILTGSMLLIKMGMISGSNGKHPRQYMTSFDYITTSYDGNCTCPKIIIILKKVTYRKLSFLLRDI